MTESLGEALPKELIRARGLVEHYVGLRGTPGVNVEPAIVVLNGFISVAEKAMIEGDLPTMIHVYQSLKGSE